MGQAEAQRPGLLEWNGAGHPSEGARLHDESSMAKAPSFDLCLSVYALGLLGSYTAHVGGDQQ